MTPSFAETKSGQTGANAPEAGYRWVICSLLFLATTINYMDRQILGILADVLQRDIGWTETQYGFIAEPVFAFIPESCSRSSRNPVRKSQTAESSTRVDTPLRRFTPRLDRLKSVPQAGQGLLHKVAGPLNVAHNTRNRTELSGRQIRVRDVEQRLRRIDRDDTQ